jgi:hypothetical protein
VCAIRQYVKIYGYFWTDVKCYNEYATVMLPCQQLEGSEEAGKALLWSQTVFFQNVNESDIFENKNEKNE